MLIKTPAGNYVFYKETDSIIIKQKTTENKRTYDGELMEMGETTLFITLVRENGTQLLLDMVGSNKSYQLYIFKRMAKREVENLVLNIVKAKESDVIEMIRPDREEIEREIKELKWWEM